MVSYEEFTAITQSLPFIIIICVVWFLIGIVLYLIIAGSIKARYNGKKLGKSMLSNRNAWLVPLIIWILQALVILFGLIFPYWMKI